jgi:hypothetical protein
MTYKRKRSNADSMIVLTVNVKVAQYIFLIEKGGGRGRASYGNNTNFPHT